MKNYYQILGTPEDASPKQIKTAYRKLARESHPDTNRDDPVAATRFKEINEAYETLGGSQSRANYDARLHGNHFNFGDVAGDVFQHIDEMFVNSAFGDFFSAGFGKKRKNPSQNLDLTVKIELTFEECVLGCIKTIRFSRNATCGNCRGSGASPNSDLANCQTCHGTGVFSHKQGFMSIRVTCHACGGAGKFITHPCKGCRGNGVTPEKKEVTINIPPGIDENSLLQVQGHGHVEKHTGDVGKLLVKLRILSSSTFERKGLDILSTKHVPFTTLTLGGNLSINTVHGDASIFIEPGTENGHVVKTKGYGVKLQSGEVGSHLTKLTVEIPVRMNQKQTEALRSFQETME